MQKSPLQLTNSKSLEKVDFIVVRQFSRFADEYLADCQIRAHSPRTIDLRRILLQRLEWYLNSVEADTCGRIEIRRFFAYLTTSHANVKGRWDKGQQQQWIRPLSSATLATYHHHLKAFFNWLVGEEYLTISPMEKIAPPTVRADQVIPFTKQQIESLLHAARNSKYPQRDEAVVRFLLDTGIRVSELCELTCSR